MPFTNKECPHCGESLHSDDLFEGTHTLGCMGELPSHSILFVLKQTERNVYPAEWW